MAVAMLAKLSKSPSQRTKSQLVGALHSLANCSEIVSSSEEGIVLYPALLHGTGCSKGIDDCGCCGAGRTGVPVQLRETSPIEQGLSTARNNAQHRDQTVLSLC